MPELIEVEYYRVAAEAALNRTVVSVQAPDDWFLKDVTARQVRSALKGTQFTEARRRGKLLTLDTAAGPVLGLRFGMTGRIIVDEAAPIDQLEYSSDRDDPAWDRFGVTFEDGGSFTIRDPRRLGGVTLDPDESALGPEASTVDAETLAGVLANSRTALKARLMDQKRLAGLGNLLTDETLWRAALSPARPANSLGEDEVAHLAQTIRSTVADLTRRGGSHAGDLQSERVGGHCPLDGAELRREQIGGRTTIWCPEHQA